MTYSNVHSVSIRKLPLIGTPKTISASAVRMKKLIIADRDVRQLLAEQVLEPRRSA